MLHAVTGCSKIAKGCGNPCPLPHPCRIHHRPHLPLHRAENLAIAFDFIKRKERIHIVNIGKCGLIGKGGEGEEGRSVHGAASSKLYMK